METEKLAQTLFEAYVEVRGGKDVHGNNIPPWDEAQAKPGWIAVADKAKALLSYPESLGPATSAEAGKVDNAQTRNRKVAEAASAGKFEAAKDGGMVLTGAGHDATGVNPNNEERQSQVKRIEAERKAKAAKVAATRAKAQKQAATKKSK